MVRTFVKSFQFAFEGLAAVFMTQRNFRLQVFTGLAAAALAIFLDFSNIEWAILILTIALVLSFEMINTAIEVVVDLSTTEIHPKAKLAKDLSAAAVLINAIVALLVGMFIFIPHLLKFFKL